MPKSALPEHLRNRNHEDYCFPFSLIPRGWTAFKWPPPQLMFGKVYECEFGGVRPAQLKGWHISGFNHIPVWFCITFPKLKMYFGIGARWDGLDGYYQFPSINFCTIENYDARYKDMFGTK